MTLRSSIASLGMSARRILLRERLAPRLQRGLLGFGERAHLRVGRGIGQHRVEVGDLALDAR